MPGIAVVDEAALAEAADDARATREDYADVLAAADFDNARVMQKLVALREKARAAVVQLGALTGWDDQGTRAAVTALAALDGPRQAVSAP